MSIEWFMRQNAMINDTMRRYVVFQSSSCVFVLNYVHALSVIDHPAHACVTLSWQQSDGHTASGLAEARARWLWRRSSAPRATWSVLVRSLDGKPIIYTTTAAGARYILASHVTINPWSLTSWRPVQDMPCWPVYDHRCKPHVHKADLVTDSHQIRRRPYGTFHGARVSSSLFSWLTL